MKIKVNRSKLQTNVDIWNVVLSAYGEYVFPTEDEIMNDFFILFNYYCELESGGHESLFNWFSKHIEVMGIQMYLERLTKMLEKVEATEYAEIEKNYLEELWRLFLAVENSKNEEPHYESLVEEFYILIEKADSEYRDLGEELSERLSNYAAVTYTEIIEIVG
ncbi:DMP19 family protein [Psychrobacillus lasiicapitis]|uniref:DNA mimic protein DMP19 C-terminal domain-containing protein n=1 Tax=Psychrobacillus lasiicapitis TaxID=1636719 RepID=A0A544TI43_9BACI|nr:hypothetical protein [Psychrobacillus lasiicapitis]TQR17125.1 hypothetical protein FG382_02990 [Psychrobacillus lasiicapitis]GGA24256.1 hypothetical protein GCM10011384_11810 [Psychrobacillus lasiicapitis]